MQEIDKILAERGKVHGDYSKQANLADAFINLIPKESRLGSAVQAQSLNMILVKLSRILTGNPNHVDHWADIAGYATLVVRDLEAASVSSITPLMKGVDPIEKENSVRILTDKPECHLCPSCGSKDTTYYPDSNYCDCNTCGKDWKLSYPSMPLEGKTHYDKKEGY